MPRAEIAQIVSVCAIGDCGKTPRGSQPDEFAEKFRLAMVAAVRVVGDVERIIELPGLDAFVTQARFPDKGLCLPAIMRGKAAPASEAGRARCPSHLLPRGSSGSRSALFSALLFIANNF